MRDTSPQTPETQASPVSSPVPPLSNLVATFRAYRDPPGKLSYEIEENVKRLYEEQDRFGREVLLKAIFKELIGAVRTGPAKYGHQAVLPFLLSLR
jgi:hypothetical protein